MLYLHVGHSYILLQVVLTGRLGLASLTLFCLRFMFQCVLCFSLGPVCFSSFAWFLLVILRYFVTTIEMNGLSGKTPLRNDL